MAHGTRSGAAVKKLVSGPGFNHLVEARHGYVLHNVNDHYVGRSIERCGEWSPGETALFRQFCRPGHYVVDVGAHIGTHTLAFARLVGDRGRVFAFEPQRLVAQMPAANVAPGSLTNVHTHQLGVGAENGTLQLPDIDYSRKHNSGGVSLEAVAHPASDPHPKYRVTVVRLDDFYDQPRLDFIKIDVEGMEADVLRGRRGADSPAQARHLRGERQAREVARVIGLVRSHGYRLFWAASWRRRPPSGNVPDGRPWYRGGKMNGTTEVVVPIVVSIVGTGIGIVGVLGLVLRILTTNVTKQFEATAAQMTGMKTDLGARIDETNRRIDDVKTELGRRIDDVKTELGRRIDETNERIDETNKRIDARTDDTNRQIENLASEMHQGFDRVHRELGENRERMAKLEGSLDGFLAGRRDRAAA